MSDAVDPFTDACGLPGPLEIEWDDWETGQAVRRTFARPTVLVGHNLRADLIFNHPGVSKRHAYLQVIEGRLHAIDLESRDGLRWGGVPRRSGWIDRGRPLQLGPTTIRVVGGEAPVGPLVGPGPLSSRYVARQPLPDVDLEIRDAQGGITRQTLDRVLTLVGSSPLCKVALKGPEASRFACSLARTPTGVWMVDLLSSRTTRVNGVACREAWLDDRDLIQVGDRAIRVLYRAAAKTPARSADGPMLPALFGSLARPNAGSGTANDPGWELIPEALLRQLPDRDGPMPEPSSAPFNQALLMLIRLLGEMHRDHLEVVRDEMEQIRRLNQEMNTLRAQLSASRTKTRPVTEASPKVADPLPASAEPEPVDLNGHRLAPQAVQDIVGKRLAAWEKERQSRWRKVMDLLVKP